MNSLRRRLLVSLWLTLALVGVGSAVITFFVTQQETNELLDYQLEQIATFVGAQSFVAASPMRVRLGLKLDRDVEDAYVVSIRDVAGNLLYASRPEIKRLSVNWLGVRTVTLGRHDYRVLSAQSGTQRIAVAQRMEVRRETAAGAALSALLPVVILIPILGLVISFVIRRQLQPLGATALEVARRPPLALDPLPVLGLPDEVLPLVNEINRLLARLHAASEHEQRFIADAAHALRTPLAALQLQADVLDGSTDATKRANRIAELRAGIRRAVRLSNHLLLLARHEPAGGPIVSQIDLDLAMTEAFELYAPIAATRGVQLRLKARSGAVVRGDAGHMAQLAGNLLDNAIRHSPTGGCVDASVFIKENNVCIEIVDEGPGLPDLELEKIFERFYRAPGNATEGSGLGLAVVRGIAERIGGRVLLENRADRSGLIARVWLPRVRSSRDLEFRNGILTGPGPLENN